MEEGSVFRRLAGPIENEYVRKWKAAGGRIVGFFCAQAPEELLWAAGMLPLRLRGTGSEDTSTADQYLGSVNCGFVRHTLSRLASGELDFLDGLLLTNSCDHLRRLSDMSVAKQLAPLCLRIDVPQVRNEAALGRLIAQLRVLKERIEGFTGAAITEHGLAATLKLYNRTRLLLTRASRLRSEDPPRISGSEVLAMAVAAVSMPKDQFNELLERRLEEIEGNGGLRVGPRLMIVGGSLDDPSYLEVIESLGATVVADQLCWCAKSFSNQTDEELDPLEAIARRMLDHVGCPRMLNDFPVRFASLVETARENRVDGIICERLKFCDLWGGESEMLRRALREQLRLPFLVLDRDYLTAGSLGQLRTRVQAFIETMA